jgi:uncharacterized protein YabE (DUF348 family)
MFECGCRCRCGCKLFVNSLHTISILSGTNTNNPRITQSRIYKKLATQEIELGKRKRVVNFRVEL